MGISQRLEHNLDTARVVGERTVTEERRFRIEATPMTRFAATLFI